MMRFEINLRALADADILDISNKAGNAMRWDDVAMVLNGSFAPTHRLVLKTHDMILLDRSL